MKLEYTKNNESNSEFYLISDKNKKNRIPRQNLVVERCRVKWAEKNGLNSEEGVVDKRELDEENEKKNGNMWDKGWY